MAYILGFMYADGNIVETKKGYKYIAIYTADRPLLQKMKVCMQVEHKVSLRNVRSGHVYRIQISSQKWFSDLEKLGLLQEKQRE